MQDYTPGSIFLITDNFTNAYVGDVHPLAGLLVKVISDPGADLAGHWVECEVINSATDIMYMYNQYLRTYRPQMYNSLYLENKQAALEQQHQMVPVEVLGEVTGIAAGRKIIEQWSARYFDDAQDISTDAICERIAEIGVTGNVEQRIEQYELISVLSMREGPEVYDRMDYLVCNANLDDDKAQAMEDSCAWQVGDKIVNLNQTCWEVFTVTQPAYITYDGYMHVVAMGKHKEWTLDAMYCVGLSNS